MEALNRLKIADRTVIYLRYFLELTEAEMAVTLGCRPGTVKSRLSRALGRLKTALGGDEANLFENEARDG
jgi:RNA polymerase sigma-70 factor (ECF subfamily)